MKQRTITVLSLLLAATLLLTSCGLTGIPQESGEATTVGTESTTSATPETTTAATAETESSEDIATEPAQTKPPMPPVTADAEIVVSGKAKYQIIISDEAGSDSKEMTWARTIAEEIQRLTGATVQIKTDWLRAGTAHNPSTYEILLGNTNYEETAQVAETIGYGDCAIRAMGNKIVLFAYSDQVLSSAISHFNIMLYSGRDATGKSITVNSRELDQVVTISNRLNRLPVYEGGTFYAYYEAGMDCDEIILRDTTPAQYRAYLEQIEAGGFTRYTDHQMAANLFATYTDEKFTVTVGYYDYEKAVRILIEPLAPAVGLAEENVYTPITTSQITMLGAAYQTSEKYVGNGLSVLIRLTDGRFVIVDGGHNYVGCTRALLGALREQSAEYAKSDKEITIAAWIITHAHGDHHGVLNSNYQVFRNMNVERVLINALSETERLASVNSTAYSANWGKSEGKVDATLTAAKALGATVYQIHVGQVFHLADLTMEVLYTIESFAPNTCNALNTTSNVIRMQFGGKDGTVYLSTGDATGNGMEICSDMYGQYIQSDIVQVCHHGYSTWGNDAGMIKAYKTVNAPTLLWPQGHKAYLSSRTLAYNHVLFTVPNFKEVLVSDTVGTQVILPIPYTVGSAQTVRDAG